MFSLSFQPYCKTSKRSNKLGFRSTNVLSSTNPFLNLKHGRSQFKNRCAFIFLSLIISSMNALHLLEDTNLMDVSLLNEASIFPCHDHAQRDAYQHDQDKNNQLKFPSTQPIVNVSQKMSKSHICLTSYYHSCCMCLLKWQQHPLLDLHISSLSSTSDLCIHVGMTLTKYLKLANTLPT